MIGYLKLWIRNYGDGTGELYAKVETHEFSGLSHACFNLSDLNIKAGSFAQYPLPLKDSPHIIGGYWTEDAKEIKEEHLFISAYPINQRGGIGLIVRLSVPYEDNERAGVRYSVSVELKTNYEQILKFSKKLSLLILEEIDELVFNERE